MSSKHSDKKNLPVFDFPALSSGEKESVIKRFLSNASRSLLAEKNIPIQPSRQPGCLKCYSANSQRLYRQKAPRKTRQTFFVNRNLNHDKKPHDSYIENSYDFFKNFQIRIKKAELPLICDSELSQVTDSTKLTNRLISEKSLTIKSQIDRQIEFAPDKIKLLSIIPNPRLSIPESAQQSLRQQFKIPTISQNLYHEKLQAPFKDQIVLKKQRYQQNISIISKIIQPDLEFEHYKGIRFFKLNSFANFFTSLTKDKRKYQLKSNFISEVCHFDFPPEIGKNFVISYQEKLSLRALKAKKLRIKNYPFSLSELKLKTSDYKFINSTPGIKPEIDFARKKLDIQLKIHLKPLKNLTLPFKSLQKQLEKPKDISQALPIKLSEIRESSWNKLRLCLKRVKPQTRELNFNSITTFKPSIPLLKPTQIDANKSFKNYRFQDRANSVFEAFTSYAFTFKPQRLYYCKKRERIFLKTRSQAIYSKNLLSPDLILSNQIQQQREIKKENLSGCINSTISAPQKDQFEYFILPTKIKLSLTDFALSLSEPKIDFSDIKLPKIKKKAKDFKESFSMRLASLSLRRRLRPIQSYLQNRIFTEFSFEINLRKTISRISLLFKPFRLNKLKATPQFINKSLAYNGFTQKEIKFKKTLPTIASASFLEYLPMAIAKSLTLEMPIMGSSAPQKLIQKHFIGAPLWDKYFSEANIKLRLPPFPFGFPKLIDKKFIPNLLWELPTLRANEFSIPAIKIRQDVSLKRLKKRRSPLSLKAPQKWLWPEFLMYNQLKYADLITDLILETLKLPHQKSFSFTWQQETSNKVTLKYSASQERSNIELPSTLEFNANISETLYSTGEISDSFYSVPLIKGSEITRLIIPALKLKAKKSKFYSAPLLRNISAAKIKTWQFPKQNFFPAPFHLPSVEFKQTSKKVLAFYQDLPEKLTPEILPDPTGYKSRYRQFFFPYTPETMLQLQKSEHFFELEDVSISAEQDFTEDLKTTQILESSIFEANQPLDSFYSNKVSVSKSPDKFIQSASNILIKLPSPGFPINLPDQLTIEPKNISLANDKAKTILNLKSEIDNLLNDSTTLTALLADHFKPDEPEIQAKLHFWPKRAKKIAPNKLSLSSVHWVILLKTFLKLIQVHNEQPTFIKKQNLDISIFSYSPIEPRHNFTPQSSKVEFSFSSPEPAIFHASANQGNTNFISTIKWPQFKATQKTFSTLTNICSQEFTPVPFSYPSQLSSKQITFSSVKYGISTEIKTNLMSTPVSLISSRVVTKPEVFSISESQQKDKGFRFAYIPDWYDLELDTSRQIADMKIKK